MKVIKEGNSSCMRVICKKCNAILQLASEDIITEHISDIADSVESDYYQCPCCYSYNLIRFY